MLSLQQVNKIYADGKVALNAVDLTLQNGLYGLLGPNGAGKSSLMRTLATIQLPSSGKVIYQQQDLADNPLLLRKELGYLPQHFGVYNHISCHALLEHLAILKGLENKKQRLQQIDQLLELTNLSRDAKRNASDFSGGMLQRFGLAQALLGQPKVLILDEPTSGLDPAERLNLHQIMDDISQSRIVLLSTHIVDDIEHLCARSAILLDGEIKADGVTRELFEPLNGSIWQCPAQSESTLPAGAKVLSRALRYGERLLRVYCPFQPVTDAISVSASLQDRYFCHLNHIAVGETL
ncbi:ATP-binding cassette domain-containing protein [Neptunicella marina]|uniref:ATP-binding cassette domain-containing protein n=1 Tax=Neptunicella marina TaxID=2125989 RepID=A0A8J6M329_9ALTE|nr:ATP-binding cassette domain-containing protein [Neptunicella marina]MBC3767063.1 ATP-binding cassette domain-containing protein [Neptunicella marina]